MQLTTIKRRAHFLRVRGGSRWACPSFALECRSRLADLADAKDNPLTTPVPRFGFTVTKKLGNAVVRNRIKRRLREAVRHSASPYAQPDHDYVLIARDAALRRTFADLVIDLQMALQRVHAKGGPIQGAPRKTTRSGPLRADAATGSPKPRTPASD